MRDAHRPPLTFASVFAGIEGASVAWKEFGWRALWVSEIDPAACTILEHHYPDVPNLGDMTRLAERVRAREVPAPDILVGGSPCFTAGHMVLTSTGYQPIEDIVPGDQVMTHAGRLRRVVRVGSQQSLVGRLRACGLPDSIVCTPEHPFLSVAYNRQNTRRHGRYARIEHCGEPQWTPAQEMSGKQWCALQSYEMIPTEIRSRKFSPQNAMYVAGLYLGDGYIRRWKGKSKKAVTLCLNPKKYEKMKERLGDISLPASRENTTFRVTICDTVLADWLVEHFGQLSHQKTLPAWVLSSPYRADLLQGFLDTDGHRASNGSVSISCTSPSLSYGIADLLNVSGYVSFVAFIRTPDTCVIEGRTVNQRDYYHIRGFPSLSARKSRVRQGYLLRTVRSFKPEGEQKVFNIEVEDDHSYIVNGAIVHNCQSYSVAGARRGLSDPRGALTLAYVQLVDTLDAVRLADGKPPIVVLWENVPGVLTSRDNAFGCFLGGLAGEDCALEPPGRKWSNAGCVLGPQRTVAWRVLDAQYFGVAQRRRRVFAVASARDGADPTAILFESEGRRRDTAPGRETGQDVTGTLSARTQGGGGLGTDFECTGGLTVYAPEMAPSLTASGRGVARARESREQDPVVAYGGNRTSGPIDCATACNAHGGTGRLDFESETFVVCGPMDPPAPPRSHNGDVQADAPLLIVHGSQDPCVSEHIAFALGRNHGQENAVAYGDVAHTLRGKGFDASEDGTGRSTPLVPCQYSLHEIAHTLRSNPYNNSDPVAESSMHVLSYGAVRRLTPRECEKLQGLPVDYTLVPDPQRGKTKRDRKTKHDPEMQDYWRRGGVDPALLDRKLLADGPRYKAIGNGFAVPVVRWIGARIHKALTAAILRDEDAA